MSKLKKLVSGLIPENHEPLVVPITTKSNKEPHSCVQCSLNIDPTKGTGPLENIDAYLQHLEDYYNADGANGMIKIRFMELPGAGEDIDAENLDLSGITEIPLEVTGTKAGIDAFMRGEGIPETSDPATSLNENESKTRRKMVESVELNDVYEAIPEDSPDRDVIDFIAEMYNGGLEQAINNMTLDKITEVIHTLAYMHDDVSSARLAHMLEVLSGDMEEYQEILTDREDEDAEYEAEKISDKFEKVYSQMTELCEKIAEYLEKKYVKKTLHETTTKQLSFEAISRLKQGDDIVVTTSRHRGYYTVIDNDGLNILVMKLGDESENALESTLTIADGPGKLKFCEDASDDMCAKWDVLTVHTVYDISEGKTLGVGAILQCMNIVRDNYPVLFERADLELHDLLKRISGRQLTESANRPIIDELVGSPEFNDLRKMSRGKLKLDIDKVISLLESTPIASKDRSTSESFDAELASLPKYVYGDIMNNIGILYEIRSGGMTTEADKDAAKSALAGIVNQILALSK